MLFAYSSNATYMNEIFAYLSQFWTKIKILIVVLEFVQKNNVNPCCAQVEMKKNVAPTSKRKRKRDGRGYDSDDSFVVHDSAFDDDLIAVGA